jgi:hypothetical protein
LTPVRNAPERQSATARLFNNLNDLKQMPSDFFTSQPAAEGIPVTSSIRRK